MEPVSEEALDGSGGWVRLVRKNFSHALQEVYSSMRCLLIVSGLCEQKEAPWGWLPLNLHALVLEHTENIIFPDTQAQDTREIEVLIIQPILLLVLVLPMGSRGSLACMYGADEVLSEHVVLTGAQLLWEFRPPGI